MIQKLTEDELFEYFEKIIKAGNFPRVVFAARRFGVSLDTIRVKVRNLIHDGRLVKYKKQYYLPGDPRLERKDEKRAPGKRFISEETRQKMSEGGMAGALALKQYAFENGKERFKVGSARDEDDLQQRIEAIVEKAKRDGTYCHPRPVYVVLIGQKAG